MLVCFDSSVFHARFVGAFISRKDRLRDMGNNPMFTNLYVKNFGEELDDETLRELFGNYGNIVSSVVMKDKTENKSLGYGFVSYDSHESAAKVRPFSLLMSCNMCTYVVPWTISAGY